MVGGWVPLDCACGYEAEMPAAHSLPVEAVFGMKVVYDPPGYRPAKHTFPDKVECRKCGRIYRK